MKEKIDFNEIVFFRVFSLRHPLEIIEVTDFKRLYLKNHFELFLAVKNF